ncbi:MAG: RDD family protein [Myxococcota bacterium]
MNRPHAIELVGPEGVPLRFELASLIERGFAFSFDLFFIGVATVLLLIPALLAGSIVEDAVGVVFLLGLFVVRSFYFFGFETLWRGATPGKRILDLRVVSRDGGRLGVDAIFARNLMRDVELFLPMVVWLAPATLVGASPPWLWLPALAWVFVLSALPFLTRERERMGDMVGGSRVVRVPGRSLMSDKGKVDGSESSIRFSPTQLEVYGEHELETLARLLRTIDQHEVAHDDVLSVADTIARRIEYVGREPVNDPVTFLRTFYVQQRAALEKKLLFGRRKADKHDVAG